MSFKKSQIIITIIFLPVILFFVMDMIVFLAHAGQAEGEVVRIDAENFRCDVGPGRGRGPCTKFTAVTAYTVEGKKYQARVSAGREREYNQPVEKAKLRPGHRMVVFYDLEKHEIAKGADSPDIWLGPISWVMLYIICMIVFSKNFRETAFDRAKRLKTKIKPREGAR